MAEQNNAEYVVTHYTIRAIDPEMWIDLPFITRMVQDGEQWYLFGFDRCCLLPLSDIQRRVDAGNVGELQMPHSMTRRQMLWLTPDGDIYLARVRNPQKDDNKKLVGSVPDWVRAIEPMDYSWLDEYRNKSAEEHK